MIKFKPNLPLSAGLLLYAATLIVEVPAPLYRVVLLCALALELWGIIIIAKSPEMKNSKLRRWKLRLIGKGQK